MNDWNPRSWRTRPTAQPLAYPDEAGLEAAVARLARLPPLVTSWEVERLRAHIAEAAGGNRFVLQGGNCAETFDDCEARIIADKLKILLQMSLLIIHGSQRPILRIGRFAGQYAKPRSNPMEIRDGIALPSYYGDVYNGIDFTEAARRPDPQRLLIAYKRAGLTLNFIRSLSDGGFADLHHPENWELDFVEHSAQAQDYRDMARRVGESLRFMEMLTGRSADMLGTVTFYTSHEGLNLYYEEGQTRQVPRRSGWYLLSTHFPWIGDRTRQLDGAHVEFFRGIVNPIGVKVGPTMTPEELVELLDALDPDREPGRISLIHRFGISRIAESLPPLLDAVRRTGRSVLWISDPMHGNTRQTAAGLKTRTFDDIIGELVQGFEIHADAQSRLGGVHFELTGDNVTECTGGARGLDDEGLSLAYETTVDPRLNYEQALEMAMLIARRMSAMNRAATARA